MNDVLRAPSRLRDLGIPVLDLAVSVYLRDPDGQRLEYISMLDATPRPDLGVLGWSAWNDAHEGSVV